MEMNPRQQARYDSLTPIGKIMYQYEKSEEGSTEAIALMYEAWSLVETFEEVVEVADNTTITWEEFFPKALTLAKTKDNAFELMFRTESLTEEELQAIDKFLELCEYKEDVEEMMHRICEYAGLEFESYFIKIFKRGHELPHRPESEEPDDE